MSERLRSSLALVPVPAQLRRVPQQLRQVPEQLRSSVRRLVRVAGTRLRATLDLPSGTELQELLARVEEIDRRLGTLQTKQGGNDDKPPAKPAAAKPAKKKANNGTIRQTTAGKKVDAGRKARVNKIAQRAKAGNKAGRAKR